MFGKMEGVQRCVVGYTGGKQRNPTYQRILDHTEALLIEFDPSQTSYKTLLEAWIRMHAPHLPSGKCQYRSVVWYTNDEQKEMVEGVFREIKKSRGAIHSGVEPAIDFYQAEDYHQDFMLKQFGQA